ncbi:MAG: box helicase-like protein, partial [Daejeonella sp.]|nr:box helicase-like protein [Daejeonella sp.]
MKFQQIVEAIVDSAKQAPRSVYKRGLEIFIRSGHKIGIEEQTFDEGTGSFFISLDVPSQSSPVPYSVTFDNDQESLGECGCLFSAENGICKHIVAASLFMQKEYRNADIKKYVDPQPELFPSLVISDQPNPAYSFRIPLSKVTVNNVQHLTNYADQQLVSRRGPKSVRISQIEPRKRWIATVKLKNETRKVSFYCDESNNLVIERSVKEPDAYHLTRFEAAALHEAIYLSPHQFFQSLINTDQEKNKVLKQYGLSLADPESKTFKFSTSYRGDLEFEAPANILKINDNKQFSDWLTKLNVAPKNNIVSPEKQPTDIQELGLLFNFSQSSFCGFSFDAFRIIQLASKRSFKKMAIRSKEDILHLKALPPEVQLGFMQLIDKSIEQRIHAVNDRYYYYDKNDPRVVSYVQNFYFDFFHQHLEYLSTFPFLYKLDVGANFGATTLKPVMVSTERFLLAFKVELEEKMVSLQAFIVLGKKKIRMKKSSLSAGFIVEQNEVLYFPKNREDISVCNTFRDGGIKIHKDGVQNFLTQIVIPLSNKYPVEFPEGFETELYETIDEKAIYLRELSEKFLLIQPAFKYGSTVLEYDGNSSEHHTTLEQNTITRINRQKTQEDEFIKWMKTLHPDFNSQFTNPYFYVSFTQAMKDRWFIDFCHTLR